MIPFSALHWNYYPVLWRVPQVLLDISAHYPWAMGMLLGNVHPSELERLDKPCVRAGIELATIRSSVDNSDHSANSSLVWLDVHSTFKRRLIVYCVGWLLSWKLKFIIHQFLLTLETVTPFLLNSGAISLVDKKSVILSRKILFNRANLNSELLPLPVILTFTPDAPLATLSDSLQKEW